MRTAGARSRTVEMVALASCAFVVVWITVLVPATRAAAAAAGSWRWPVTGPVIRGFEQPTTPYSAGHRGIDIAAPFGTPVVAPAKGTVSFAGWVAGAQYVTLDHSGGYKSTDSWVSQIFVTVGQVVKGGQTIALTGHGHPDVLTPHLHFSVRLDDVYIDPMTLLATPNVADVIHLAPLGGADGSSSSTVASISGSGVFESASVAADAEAIASSLRAASGAVGTWIAEEVRAPP